MTRNDTLPAVSLIDAAIDHHGARAVFLAAIAALLRPRAEPLNAGRVLADPPFGAHLRRDIGLAPEARPPTWELLR